jgi:hypothetical protein
LSGHAGPDQEAKSPLKVAFVGPMSAQAHALVQETNVELVESPDSAEVVHVTVPPANVVEAVEGLLASARTVVLHARPADLDPIVIGQLAATAATRGVVVAVPFVHRYYPMVRLARRRVRSGTPGPLHLVHGWSAPDAVAAWCDLVEFISRHRVSRLTGTSVDSTRADSEGDTSGTPGAMAVAFETDRGAVGTLAVSQTRPVEGGTLLAAFDGVDESIVFHEGRPEVLDVMGARSTQRFQRGVGADVSRYSTQPAGHPQGHRDCWASFIKDAHAAGTGGSPDGLPTLVDLARSASIAASVRDTLSGPGWVRVSLDVDLELVNTTEGRTA